MKWRLLRAIFLAFVPFAVLALTLEARLALGMGPWDIRLSFVSATLMGMWMLTAWQQYGPNPHGADGGGGVHHIKIGVPVGELGSPDPCAGCGQVHEPVIYVPLPDGTALVSHKDRDGCEWAMHVEELDALPTAVRFHQDFECTRRVNQAQ